jgi:hypothetical protein
LWVLVKGLTKKLAHSLRLEQPHFAPNVCSFTAGGRAGSLRRGIVMIASAAEAALPSAFDLHG